MIGQHNIAKHIYIEKIYTFWPKKRKITKKVETATEGASILRVCGGAPRTLSHELSK